MGCLYKIKFPSGKEYVGVTKKTAELRFNQHIKDSKKYSKRLIHLAIKKYGHNNCIVETLVISNDFEYLKNLEIKAIASFNTKSPYGYNCTNGGDGVIGLDSQSEKTRISKMRKTMSHQSYIDKQKEIQKSIWNDEKKQQRSNSVKKLWRNEEYREKVKKSHTGKQETEETKKRKSSSMKTFWHMQDKSVSSSFFKNIWKQNSHIKKMKNVREQNKQGHSDKMKEFWKDPEWSLKTKESMKSSFSDDRIKKMSEAQKIKMQDLDLRIQIAVSMSKYKGKKFQKLKNEISHKRGGIVKNTWHILNEVFSIEDALRLGWVGSKHIDRCISKNWIKIIE